MIEQSIELAVEPETILQIYQMIHLLATPTLVENLFQKILSNYESLSKKDAFQDLDLKTLQRLYAFKNPEALKILQRSSELISLHQNDNEIDKKVLKQIRAQKQKQKKKKKGLF